MNRQYMTYTSKAGALGLYERSELGARVGAQAVAGMLAQRARQRQTIAPRPCVTVLTDDRTGQKHEHTPHVQNRQYRS